MLQIKDLTITHRKDLRVIIEDFQMVLNAGDKAVMIGEEGNGKSTIMRYLYNNDSRIEFYNCKLIYLGYPLIGDYLYNPDMVEEYAECSGERILGKETLGYLPQELPAEDKEKTVYEFFSDADYFWNQSPKDLAKLAKDYQVSSEFFYSEQKMQSLSGGEKVKAQLMKLLMLGPSVLLLDEPSNDIDIATLELIEKLILDWKGIVLFISHDETLIEKTANMVIHIEQIMRKTKSRYTIAHLPYRRYVEERLHQFERQEQQALNDRREKQIREEKYRRLLQKVEHAQATVSRKEPAVSKNLKDKMHSVKSMGKRFEREDAKMTEMPDQARHDA